jgi:hypothetical protein
MPLEATCRRTGTRSSGNRGPAKLVATFLPARSGRWVAGAGLDNDRGSTALGRPTLLAPAEVVVRDMKVRRHAGMTLRRDPRGRPGPCRACDTASSATARGSNDRRSPVPVSAPRGRGGLVAVVPVITVGTPLVDARVPTAVAAGLTVVAIAVRRSPRRGAAVTEAALAPCPRGIGHGSRGRSNDATRQCQCAMQDQHRFCESRNASLVSEYCRLRSRGSGRGRTVP